MAAGNPVGERQQREQRKDDGRRWRDASSYDVRECGHGHDWMW
jgi:hypothetical protein